MDAWLLYSGMLSSLARTPTMRLLGWILVLPFLALCLLPTPVMATRSADGNMVLVLCTGNGPMEVTINAAGEVQHSVPEAGADTCHWAAHAAPALLTSVDLPAQPVRFAKASAVQAAALVRAAHDPHGIMARGPPATL